MSMSGSGAESGWSRLRRAPSGPSDRALHRFVGWYAAGGLRLWIAVLSGAVVLADAAVIVAMIVVHPLVVPAALIPAGALYLVIQAPATAALMALVRRGGRNAGAAIGRQLRLEQELTEVRDELERERALWTEVRGSQAFRLAMPPYVAADAGAAAATSSGGRMVAGQESAESAPGQTLLDVAVSRLAGTGATFWVSPAAAAAWAAAAASASRACWAASTAALPPPARACHRRSRKRPRPCPVCRAVPAWCWRQRSNGRSSISNSCRWRRRARSSSW